MRKLRLESLQVESFVTTAGDGRERGTVDGHQAAPLTRGCPGTGVSDCVICQPLTVQVGCGPLTYDLRCGETQYMDCTYGCTFNCSGGRGCSYGSGCPDICWIDTTDNSRACPVE
jgi:hypothetical protein